MLHSKVIAGIGVSWQQHTIGKSLPSTQQLVATPTVLNTQRGYTANFCPREEIEKDWSWNLPKHLVACSKLAKEEYYEKMALNICI